jgi:nitrite reductase/ring-hydroxylating ferredoxin subunit
MTQLELFKSRGKIFAVGTICGREFKIFQIKEKTTVACCLLNSPFDLENGGST